MSEMDRWPGLDPVALNALLEVIETGSFTAAADKLGVTQPAISLAIRKLEDRLGTSLVVRHRKGVVPSQPGHTLARGARQAFHVLGEAVATIAHEKQTPEGRIRLGCHESLAAYALPKFMARFLRLYPGVELTLWNGNSRAVETELIAGRIDLGLIVNASHHPDTIIEPLFDDAVELMCAQGFAKSKRPSQILAASTLIYVGELMQSRELLTLLKKRGLTAARYLPCSSLELVKSLVLDQVGVGVLPRRVAAYGTVKHRLKPLSSNLPRFVDHIALVRRFDLPRTAAMRVAIAELTEHGRHMAEEPPE